ncbi:MAG TPA: tRNA epoxyqueuosine(34) reductase QueG [Pirellulales bacterium]|jgi:epoxyqueuosine reductase
MSDAASLSNDLKAEAGRLGFALAGICPAVTPPGIARLDQWLAQGFAGELHYIENRRAAYEHPSAVLDGVQSIVMLAMNYRTAEPAEPAPGQGRVSRYAWGDDYHTLIRCRLDALADFLRDRVPAARARGVVDTAPLLEREFAQLAGLGWIGKNTLLLNRQIGSWFFLAALLTDVPLDYDAAHQTDHCGTCRACLDACPTGAFPAPYVLDARRCISYLTIELRGPVPQPLREGLGDWLFGCDICQQVCPWNGRAPESLEPAFVPAAERNPVDLAELFRWTDDDFRRLFRGSPLLRAKRRGLLRSAAIVLGNGGDPASLAPLACGLSDAEPLVRGAAAWALGRLATPAARDALAARLPLESDADVRGEIEGALSSAICVDQNPIG